MHSKGYDPPSLVFVKGIQRCSKSNQCFEMFVFCKNNDNDDCDLTSGLKAQNTIIRHVLTCFKILQSNNLSSWGIKRYNNQGENWINDNSYGCAALLVHVFFYNTSGIICSPNNQS
jgi:hypothetical protein